MAKRKRNLQQALSREQFNVQQRQKAQSIASTSSTSQSNSNKSKAAKEKQKADAISKWIPFDQDDSILLVGEGNFSFATSLVEHHKCSGTDMVATSYDSLSVAQEKYPDVDAHLATLKDHGVTVLFGVDAGALQKVKALKNKQFDKIVFNYPHVGAGEKDEQRNVALNQTLILRFLRSAASFLQPEREVPDLVTEAVSDDDNLDDDDDEGRPKKKKKKNVSRRTVKGSILMTLRECKPYTLWNIPMLAKKGPLIAASLLSPKEAPLQPTYVVERSGTFDPSCYPGYAHRRTIGFKQGLSFENNEDTKFSYKDRGSGKGTVTSSRMWQLALALST